MAEEAKKKSTKKKAKPTAEQVQGRRELMKALGFCIAAVIIVRSFIFEPFKIPTSSMVPTLQIGDHIFVSKYNYGFSIPFTRILFAKWGGPARGDVIVFLFPKDESVHYIKRVLGVPGDKIQFKGKEILINGEEIPKEKVEDPEILKRLTDGTDSVEVYRETISGKDHYVRYSTKKHHQLLRIEQEEVVPEGHYFVVGDNRDESYDSRSWGLVPRNYIKGKAQAIWLSLDPGESWGTDKIRWNRTGIAIH
ncbi:MAG: signal peptidase I [Bdellovibrionaceae bacterium]|nr:signal peptidase I [Bdellovibrionales bacterium]MCB9253485.1 signal peptidase I [Pseudobdellovibrionaceae bacterium]